MIDRPSFAADPTTNTPGTEPGSDWEEEIRFLLSDTTLPIAERRYRLEAMAAALGERRSAAGLDLDPLEIQAVEALELLASGGHAYRSSDQRD